MRHSHGLVIGKRAQFVEQMTITQMIYLEAVILLVILGIVSLRENALPSGSKSTDWWL